MQKSWMWHNEQSQGVNGAVIDIEDDSVQWFEEPGCSCSGSAMEQTLTDFLENGARFLMPPADIHAEMQAFVQDARVLS